MHFLRTLVRATIRYYNGKPTGIKSYLYQDQRIKTQRNKAPHCMTESIRSGQKGGKESKELWDPTTSHLRGPRLC